MTKDKIYAQLKRLAKTKYAMPVTKESDINIKTTYLSPWIMVITLACFCMAILLGEAFCICTKFERIIDSANTGDYLGIFSIHCSVVFLTTSLMTMLSEKNKYVYHVDLVRLVLIQPLYYNFFALVTYSISSILLAVLGFIVKRSSLVIGGFVFGMVAIVVLFMRMVTIYYCKDAHKAKIRQFLHDAIVCIRKIEDNKEVTKYEEIINKIGYKRQFRAIINQALIEAENRNLDFVFETMDLLEECIAWHAGDTYGNSEAVNACFHILNSNIGFKSVYHAPTKLYLEHYYIDFASVVAMKYPEEMHRHYSNEFATKPSIYLKMIRSQIYPYILDGHLLEGRKQLFFHGLTRWTQRNEHWPSISNYIIQSVMKGHEMELAEYYQKVLYALTGDLDKAERSRTIDEGNPNIAIWKQHTQIIERIKQDFPEAFEKILSYKDNRQHLKEVDLI